MPGYLALHQQGKLRQRAKQALELLEKCVLCPRKCKTNRLKDEPGLCQTGRMARVASYNLHYGEEAPLVGTNGSGTIFFAGCNLLCAFCQNFDISHNVKDSVEVTPEQLAGIMRSLQDQGAHNINFVTPTHVVPQILEALPIAADMGLHVPLVYNTSAYDAVKTIKLLDGVVDIYMPDVKFWASEYGSRFCNVQDYAPRAREAVAEMFRQVRDLQLDANGVAVSGLLVRHLVMPESIAGTKQWMKFLAKLSPNTYVNVMDQYHACGNASQHHELSRTITRQEFEQALKETKNAGITRIDNRESRMAHQVLRALLGE